MAVVDTFTRIPDSGLSNASIRAKFRSTSLAGLGFDEIISGDDESDWGGGGYTPDSAGDYVDPSAGYDPNSTTLEDPFGIMSGAGNPTVGAAPPYVDSTGNVVIPASGGGGWVYITPQGQTKTGSGSVPPRGSGNTTPSQQAAQYQLYAMLIKGGLDIAKLIAIQPGTAQTPTTTIRQNPNFPVSTHDVGINANVGLGSSTMMLVALGVGVFLLMQSKSGR